MAEEKRPSAPRDRRRSINLFRVASIQIRIDYSWFLIFLLLVWSLSAGYLPRVQPDQPIAAYWTAGIIGTLLFFGSVLAHELAHSFMAIRSGIRIPAITLFLFGGASHMEQEPSDPRTEIRIAVVGPLMSFALALVFWGIHSALPAATPALASEVVKYLAWINAALGVFNLLPGFPLDGGRVFRALAWWKTGSLRRGTRLASDAGKGLALGLMVLGGLQIFSGALLGGLWLIFIGMFLRGVAEAGYQSLVLRQLLEDAAVDDVMTRDVVIVSPDTPVPQLIENYFLARGHRGFPVAEGDKVVGLVSLDKVGALAPEKRESALVRDCMTRFSEAMRIAPEASLNEAVQRMEQSGLDRLLVMRGATLVGLISRSGLLRFVEVRNALTSSA